MAVGDIVTSASPTNTSTGSHSPLPGSQSGSNHVSTTADPVSSLADEVNLMTLDTPEPSRRGQDQGGSPTPTPTPVGMVAAASTIGVPSLGGGGTTGGGRGSGTHSPALPSTSSSQSQPNIRSRTSGASSSPQPPRPPQQLAPQQGTYVCTYEQATSIQWNLSLVVTA